MIAETFLHVAVRAIFQFLKLCMIVLKHVCFAQFGKHVHAFFVAFSLKSENTNQLSFVY